MLQGEKCTRMCRCRKCGNEVAEKETETDADFREYFACTCGKSKKFKEPSYKSCTDGNRKSKCICLKNHVACSSTCSCYNCCNGKPAENEKANLLPPKKRRRENPSPFKRRKGARYLQEEDLGVQDGPWTWTETYVLIEILRLVTATSIDATAHNLAYLYNYVVTYSKTNNINKIHIEEKSSSQINGKLYHIRKIQGIYELLEQDVNKDY